MKKEGETGVFSIDPKKVGERVAAACGVSMSTVTRLTREKRKHESSDPTPEPPKKKSRVKPVTGLDDFDLGVVRRIVNNLFADTEEDLRQTQGRNQFLWFSF
jgi:hypothetical protein